MTKLILMATEELPGADLVDKGLRDLANGELTIEALLVRIAEPRLTWLGIEIPAQPLPAEGPESALYALLAAEDSDAAHGTYNALIRRLVSYEHTLEADWGRRRRAAAPASE